MGTAAGRSLRSFQERSAEVLAVELAAGTLEQNDGVAKLSYAFDFADVTFYLVDGLVVGSDSSSRR